MSTTPLTLDPRTYDRALSCVHCGLCLPACPTYLQTANEAESPRGRIQLMRGISDGTIQPSASVVEHLDSCLDCRGCETACPSNVIYHELIEETRDRFKKNGITSGNPFLKWMIRNVLTRPRRLKALLLPANILQQLGLWELVRSPRFLAMMPPVMAKMARMLPRSKRIWQRKLPPRVVSAKNHNIFMGAQNARPTIGLFAGCVGSVFCDKINRQAIDLMTACGVDVATPPSQQCCGAMHQHGGDLDRARKLARQNIDVFLPRKGKQVDFIATPIAGCGATLKEYAYLLRDDPEYAQRAKDFVARVGDISQILISLQLPPMNHPVRLIAAYHEACHLVHAQKISGEVKQLLALIPGLALVPLAELDICCGAAGSYNLTHPKMAGELAKRKLKNFDASGATAIVAGNIGCALHLQAEAEALGRKLDVYHPVDLLHQALFG